VKLFKLFGYLFVYGVVIYTLLSCYPPKDGWGYATVATCVAGAVLLLLMSLNRAAFWTDITNPYVVGGWLSLSLFLFYLLFAVSSGEELYTFFILAAAAVVGLLNLDKPRYVVLQHEVTSSLAFARGIVWGLLSFVAANLILAIGIGLEAVLKPSLAEELIVGPVTAQVEDWLGIGVEFLLMMFAVAVPEELMARVFYLRMGSAVTDVFTAALLTMVSGYAMHAVTRYGIEYGTLILFVITVVWLMLSIAYVRHGLLASVAAHATYNTLITAAVYGYPYVIVLTIVLLAIVFLVHGMKKAVFVI